VTPGKRKARIDIGEAIALGGSAVALIRDIVDGVREIRADGVTDPDEVEKLIVDRVLPRVRSLTRRAFAALED